METTINQRLIFLLKTLNMKPGRFARALDLSETTVRNYVDRTAKPSSDVLEKIANTFKQVNLVWLITGQGSPILSDSSTTSSAHIQNNSGIGINHGQATINNLEACQRELEAMRRDAGSYQREIELLKGQLESKDAQLAGKDALIAVKDEMLDLLRGSFNRPN